ncbi:uncharacterized protein [Procambarus clarkii]|uniref:uncharacterized protein n=1 Tax=Procambarus clarkii TaxID=6728 RepID=UPI001E67003A|nr:uncharacterized protein LOC123769658 [Procambarus clarkii]
MSWRRLTTQAWMAAMVLLAQDTATIRITHVRVPETVEAGGEGDLECSWEEDSDNVYSIKWYQGAHEFYRYTPTAAHPVQIFDPPTLDVDKKKSWGGSVHIANVTTAAEGAFHCEVSADGPTFHTASAAATLMVLDLPDEGPVITGVRRQYLAGEGVDLLCTSHRARPAPHLSFTVNSQPASPGWLEPQADVGEAGELITSSLRLRFSLLPRLLRGGEVWVRCLAELPGVYQKETQAVLSTMPPYPASVLGGGATGVRPALIVAGLILVLPFLGILQHP